MTAPIEYHPGWCDPAHCTAHSAGPDLELYHRSRMVTIDTDPGEVLVAYLREDPGFPGDPDVDLLLVQSPASAQPWRDIAPLTEPMAELTLSVPSADALHHVLASLVRVARAHR